MTLEPAPLVAFEGVSYKVEFRATPGYNADGHPQSHAVMWSADLIVDEGWSLTASGQTPAEAAYKLAAIVAERSQPFPKVEVPA